MTYAGNSSPKPSPEIPGGSRERLLQPAGLSSLFYRHRISGLPFRATAKRTTGPTPGAQPTLNPDETAAAACAHSPIVTSHHPVGVQHGNELKDEHPPQHLRAGVLLTQDEVQEAVEDEAGGCFSWVDSAAQEEHLGANRQGRWAGSRLPQGAGGPNAPWGFSPAPQPRTTLPEVELKPLGGADN